MDVGALFDQLLQSGRELVAKGQNVIEQKLDIPDSGSQRDAAWSSMGKGAAAAGVAALLLGTRAGRGLTGLALKLGSLGAIGGLAYKTFQDWQAKQAEALPKNINAITESPTQPIASVSYTHLAVYTRQC